MDDPILPVPAPRGKALRFTPRNPAAITSLLLGLASLPMLVGSVLYRMPLVLLTGVPAILLGHLALRKIGRSFEEIPGGPAAKTGLRMGYAVALIIPLLILFAVPVYSAWSATAEQRQAMTNARKIATTLRLYSSDNNGAYPDAEKPPVHTSNAVFHRLFVAGVCDDEMIFGCPQSPYKPDGNIGISPDYKQALTRGENHWAMTAGLNDAASGIYPLIYENPVEAGATPKWNADASGQPKPGRCWADGKVAIGFNDTAVVMMPLSAAKGASVPLQAYNGGTDVFPTKPQPLQILNVDP